LEITVDLPSFFSMKILTLETSTMIGSIALSEDDQLLGEYQIRIKETYSDTILPLIDHLLTVLSLSIRDIDGFALTLGPGSFTSLRIGVSIIKGLAFSTHKPVVGIPSLDGLAQNVCFSKNVLVCPVVDARKGEVYTAFYRGEGGQFLTKLTPEKAITPQKLLDEIKEEVIFLGDGVDLYGKMIGDRLKEKALFAPPALRYPKASTITYLALQKFKNGEVSYSDDIIPLYVRLSEAEIKCEKRR